MCEISISGYGGFLPDISSWAAGVWEDDDIFPYKDKLRSRLALPIDLNESVSEVLVIHEDTNLSYFDVSVLSLMENEHKVLLIMAFSNDKLHLIKNKLPENNFIIHTNDEKNEEEACEWVCGKSSKKFLIADADTVAGYEFSTVIMVVHKDMKDNVSSLCQRATARLIVCLYEDEWYCSISHVGQVLFWVVFFIMFLMVIAQFYDNISWAVSQIPLDQLLIIVSVFVLVALLVVCLCDPKKCCLNMGSQCKDQWQCLHLSVRRHLFPIFFVFLLIILLVLWVLLLLPAGRTPKRLIVIKQPKNTCTYNLDLDIFEGCEESGVK